MKTLSLSDIDWRMAKRMKMFCIKELINVQKERIPSWSDVQRTWPDLKPMGLLCSTQGFNGNTDVFYFVIYPYAFTYYRY